jgi:peptidylprolyl isomerase
MKILLALTISLSSLVAGCAESVETPAPVATAKPQSDWPEGDLEKIEALFGATSETSTGLRWQPISAGTGDAHPLPGNTVIVHYRGTLLDGKIFDESYKRGEPIRFPVGMGRVIKGWDEALPMKTRGEKRRIIIPYWLAYGEKGRPPTIPPKATLVFEVELVGWESPTGS